MRDDFTAHSIVVNIYLGILILSFMILSVTLVVRLKMESLSGLTDLVVSMTKVRGGLRGLLDLESAPLELVGDSGQRAH